MQEHSQRNQTETRIEEIYYWKKNTKKKDRVYTTPFIK